MVVHHQFVCVELNGVCISCVSLALHPAGIVIVAVYDRRHPRSYSTARTTREAGGHHGGGIPSVYTRTRALARSRRPLHTHTHTIDGRSVARIIRVIRYDGCVCVCVCARACARRLRKMGRRWCVVTETIIRCRPTGAKNDDRSLCTCVCVSATYIGFVCVCVLDRRVSGATKSCLRTSVPRERDGKPNVPSQVLKRNDDSFIFIRARLHCFRRESYKTENPSSVFRFDFSIFSFVPAFSGSFYFAPPVPSYSIPERREHDK